MKIDTTSTHFRKTPKLDFKRPLLANPDANFDNDNGEGPKVPFFARFTLGKLFWMSTGLLTCWFVNFHRHLFWEWPANLLRFTMYLSMFSFALFTSLFIYLNYFMPYIQGTIITTSNWRQKSPRAITVATFSALAGFFFLFVSFWPVYRFTNFIIFPAMFFGFFSFLSLF